MAMMKTYLTGTIVTAVIACGVMLLAVKLMDSPTVTERIPTNHTADVAKSAVEQPPPSMRHQAAARGETSLAQPIPPQSAPPAPPAEPVTSILERVYVPVSSAPPTVSLPERVAEPANTLQATNLSERAAPAPVPVDPGVSTNELRAVGSPYQDVTSDERVAPGPTN